MDEGELRQRLATRLGHPVADELEIERVLIPMAAGVPRREQRVVAFGAAAGFVHPVTGYSVAASLRAAPRVASAIAKAVAVNDPVTRSAAVWDAVWPAEHRRARALHDYGLAVLLRMPPPEMRQFFEAFFALPSERWASYLRVDTTASDVARVMRDVFRTVPWRVRRRLATASPVALARVLR